MLQLAAVFYFLKDFHLLRQKSLLVQVVFTLVIVGFVLKTVLQLFSAFPFFADMAYQRRNLVIAYLHLVLLGIVSLFVMAMVLRNGSRLFGKGMLVFIVGFLLTEVLLVAGAFGFNVRWWLFIVSWLLVFGAAAMTLSVLFKGQRLFSLHKNPAI